MDRLDPHEPLMRGLGRYKKLIEDLPLKKDFSRDRSIENDPRILKTGTTTVGMVAKDGVVLATESKVTAGNLVMSWKGPKIIEVTPTIAVTTSGSVADCQHLVNLVKAHIKIREFEWHRPARTKEVASIMSNAMFKQRGYPYYSMLLLGGYDKKLPAYSGGSYLFMLDSLGSIIEEKVVATGSGSVVAYGVLESRYNEDIDIETAVKIARDAIMAAARRDVYSGGRMQLAKITAKGIELQTVELIPYKSK